MYQSVQQNGGWSTGNGERFSLEILPTLPNQSSPSNFVKLYKGVTEARRRPSRQNRSFPRGLDQVLEDPLLEHLRRTELSSSKCYKRCI
ncbi:hypothetical protein VTK26DRAFT_5350 [Humicola hyalothermophila]